MFQQTKQYPRLSVKAIFRFNNKVLYYKTIKDVKDVPGGHVEFGEKVLDALKRELNEEIGFNLNFEPKLIYNWSYIKKDSGNIILILKNRKRPCQTLLQENLSQRGALISQNSLS